MPVVASAPGDRLGPGVLLREDAAEKLLLGRLPPGFARAQHIFDVAPHRIPVALRLPPQRLVDALHIVEQARARIEKAGLVFYGHLIA